MKKIKLALSWLVVSAVMILIFCLSAQVADDSSELSEGFISGIYRFYLKLTEIPCSTTEFDNTVLSLQFIARKSAHFCIYAALGFLFSNAYFQTGITIFSKNIIISGISSIIYAITDEVHQLFVEGRSCELRDVFIDSIGSITGILVFVLIMLIWRKKWILQKP